MIDNINKAMVNITKFKESRPEINEGISDGYQAAFYDEATGMVITQEIVDRCLKIAVIEDAYYVPAPPVPGSLMEIVEALKTCGYKCEAGPLELNNAFMMLEAKAMQEQRQKEDGSE